MLIVLANHERIWTGSLRRLTIVTKVWPGYTGNNTFHSFYACFVGSYGPSKLGIYQYQILGQDSSGLPTSVEYEGTLRIVDYELTPENSYYKFDCMYTCFYVKDNLVELSKPQIYWSYNDN